MNASCDTDAHRAQFLDMVRRIGAERIFLVMPRFLTACPAREEALALLRINAAYFKANGVAEVGTWFTGMGHGAPLDHESGEEFPNFRRLVHFGGSTLEDTFCLSDRSYCDAVASYVADMGACGVDLVQLDDDLRIGHRIDDLGCVCDYHMAEFARRTGREWTREALYQAVYSGAPSETRTAWFAMMREMFYDFAKILREKLDTVSPDIRLGFCSGPMSYDPDCTDAAELARVFAGKTRPFLRGMGAPYWAAMRNWYLIEDVISYHRLESSWMKRSPDVEFFAEGDVYPRPRYRVPAWLLETFDTALRADGSLQGILKYVFDYVQSPCYETGYLAHHERNLPLYKEIEDAFAGGTARGVYIYEEEHQLLHADLPIPAPSGLTIAKNSFSASVIFANRLCLPSSFEENGDAVCLSGYAAKTMPLSLLDHGVMLDLPAAQLLQARGVDCGMASFEAISAPESESFPSVDGYEAEHLRPMTDGKFWRVTLKPGAEVLSVFRAGDVEFPAVWYYENASGQRFLCYAFAWNSVERESQLLMSYARQRQALYGLEKLQNGRKPAAYSVGHPHLYLMVKDLDDGSCAVGIWNCFDDAVLAPKVMLDRAYDTVRFIGGAQGCVEGNCVAFTTDIPAHGFAGVVVKNASETSFEHP